VKECIEIFLRPWAVGLCPPFASMTCFWSPVVEVPHRATMEGNRVSTRSESAKILTVWKRSCAYFAIVPVKNLLVTLATEKLSHHKPLPANRILPPRKKEVKDEGEILQSMMSSREEKK
jgi:hypothetical protein